MKVIVVEKDKLELYELNYFENGFDVPYLLKKGGEVLIKPILVKDYVKYEYAKQILEIKKNEINDIRVIQMSYLDFLIEYVCKQEEQMNQLYLILNLCLGFKNINVIKDKNKNCIVSCDKDNNIEKVIYSKEFDEIVDIILHQNDSNYDDRYINPDVREMMEEYYKTKYKNIVTPSFEKRKAFVSSKTGLITKQLNEIPYREFDMIYHASVDSEIYIGQKIIQGSYKYEVKEDISHPLFTPNKDPYQEVFEDTTILSGKGISGAENLNKINQQ